MPLSPPSSVKLPILVPTFTLTCQLNPKCRPCFRPTESRIMQYLTLFSTVFQNFSKSLRRRFPSIKISLNMPWHVSKIRPRGSKDAPRGSREALKTLQEAPKTLLDILGSFLTPPEPRKSCSRLGAVLIVGEIAYGAREPTIDP